MITTTRAVVCFLAALSLVSGACSSQEPDAPQAAESEEEEPTTCPLTGEEPARGVDIERPAVGVKVEDSPAARPQSGLEHADIVYEELVEGGITRFMAIYHCGDARKVGPVRSARFDDPKLARPFTEVIAYSGANGQVEGELKRRGMLILDEDSAGAGLYRIPPGSTDVHSLFADTKKLRTQAENAPAPVRDVFAFGDVPAGAKRARRIEVRFTASNPITYRWQGESWRRFEGGEPFFSGTGDQIAVPNVLAQEVEVNASGITDSVGNASPEIALQGTGRALLFRDGKVLRGTWRIRKIGQPAVFETRSGEPLQFAPGPIWIELVPSAKGQMKGSISFK